MSIFKRLFGEREDINNNSTQVFKANVNNASIKTIGSNLQKKFSKGVQYNMKIVIRGDRNVGKSALLARLKGLDFCEQYIPTDEIEVACIHWNYKTADVVKVEVWDVVDKGRKKKQSGLKLENTSNSVEENGGGSICLDAEFLDVYKGAHAVIMVLDITKSWTFNYVERELQYIPDNMPILVLGNHRDMGTHRTISTDQIQTLVENLPSHNRGLAKYWESSMKNGYGLIYIHRFFNIPFLQLQKDTLLKQLATNETEMEAAIDELDSLEEEPESVYDNFIANLKQCKKPSSLSIHSNPVSQINSPITPGVQPQRVSLTPMVDGGITVIHPPQARPIPGMDKLGLYPLPVPVAGGVSVTATANSGLQSDRRNIDEFVPDEPPELSTFLDDDQGSTKRSPPAHPAQKPSISSGKKHLETIDSSDPSDDDGAHEGRDVRFDHANKTRKQNPMVACFYDDEIDMIGDLTIGHIDGGPNDEGGSIIDDDFLSDEDVRVGRQDDHRHRSVANDQNEEDIIDEETKPVRRTQAAITTEHTDEPNPDLAISTSIPHNGHAYHDPIDSTNAHIPSILNLDDNDDQAIASFAKKKKKKHHKDSSTKDSHSRKKKKKSKSKTEDESLTEIIKTSPPNSRRPSRKSEDVVDTNNSISRDVERDFSSKRSDSLERFLND